MFEAANSPYLVPYDQTFKLKNAPTAPPKNSEDKKALKKALKENVKALADLQRVLYAHDELSVLLVFQAMDAAGKDSTIRSVFSGIDPAGCHVTSFKQPNSTELEHDFLWRCNRALPERGRFGIFNRSYYEEVLVVRVHPEYLKTQRLPHKPNLDTLWQQRYASINQFEQHLAHNGTVVIKFWLNVSLDEQKNRFLSRLEEPEKHWKFSEGDLAERALWPKYMNAYQQALQTTSHPWAPWYAIPADDKPYMRWMVSKIILDNLKNLDMHYPKVSKKDLSRFNGYKKALQAS